ncbi:kelch-like protein 2 [Octopus sinensis]|uniref:Kelch-like protein 2 n=1 Tax=Octopus sinensis TaxID=2607531 RepID=A0A6P7S9K6_9MOLL|nr:kelch-like protein 2 [Octopus sinensis]
MIESRTFNVESHSKVAFHVMYDLWRQQQLCDVIISVEGHQFHAHKIVLAGCSPYLRAMFTNGMLESEKNWVEIHGTDQNTMAYLLEFMYRGSIEITVDNVQSLLQGSSLLGLHSLRNLCAHFLQSQLTASNCLGIHYFADMYTCIELEATARHYIYQNFLDVIRTEEYLQLSEERLLDLLNSDKLQVTSEHQVFEAACHWLQCDLIHRSHVACRFLQAIKLVLLDMEYLQNIVSQSDWVRNCRKCQVRVNKALMMKQNSKALEQITPRAQPPSIYVIGGRNSIDSQLKSVERYDFLLDQWSTVPSMNIARTAVSATSYNGLLYAVGGECALADTPDDTLYLRCVECYDPVLKQWELKPELKIARSFIAVASVGGFLYAIGKLHGKSLNVQYF